MTKERIGFKPEEERGIQRIEEEPKVSSLPKKLIIGSNVYEVEESNGVIILEGQQCSGLIDIGFGKIVVDRQLSEGAKRNTLMHEVTHGIDEFLEIGLNEAKTDKVAKGMLMVLRQNPALVDYLLREE